MGTDGKSIYIASVPDMHAAPVVRVRDGAVYADSREVAAFFGKQHKHVLSSIDALVAAESAIEPYFRPNEVETKVGFGVRKRPRSTGAANWSGQRRAALSRCSLTMTCCWKSSARSTPASGAKR